jgi:hypothetical protein
MERVVITQIGKWGKPLTWAEIPTTMHAIQIHSTKGLSLHEEAGLAIRFDLFHHPVRLRVCANTPATEAEARADESGAAGVGGLSGAGAD